MVSKSELLRRTIQTRPTRRTTTTIPTASSTTSQSITVTPTRYVVIQGKRYSESEYNQAKSLIFRGKEFAARGDKRLMGLITELRRTGSVGWEENMEVGQQEHRDIQTKIQTLEREGYDVQVTANEKGETQIVYNKPKIEVKETPTVRIPTRPISEVQPTDTSVISRAKMLKQTTKTYLRGRYSYLFEPKPSSDPLTVRKVAGEVSAGFFIRASRRAGELPGTIIEQTGFKGVETIVPETMIPQKVTLGGEITTPEYSVFVGEPETIKKVGGIAADVGKYFVVPIVPLAVAGGLIVTAPKTAQVTTSERIEGAIMTTPLLFKSLGKAAKPIRKYFEPYIKPLPTGKPTYKAINVIQPVTKRGSQFEKAFFSLERKVPAQKGLITTRFAESKVGKLTRGVVEFEKKYIKKGTIKPPLQRLGKYVRPQKITLRPEKLSYAWTPEPLTVVKGKVIEPAYFVRSSAAKKPTQVTVYGLAGEQVPFEIKSVVGEKYYKGALVGEKLGKLKEIGFELFPVGKRVTRTETSSVIKRILKTEQGEVYKGVTVLRDVTKPLSRSKRSYPIISETSYVKKAIDLTPSGDSIISRKLYTGLITKQKPVTETLGTLTEVKGIAVKSFPKVKPIKVLTTQELAPSYVGGEGKGVSAYYGQGLVGDEVTIYSTTTLPTTRTTLTTTPATITIPKIKTEVFTKTLTVTGQKFKTDQAFKTGQLVRTDLSVKTDQIIKTDQTTKLLTALKTKQATKQVTKQATKQLLTTRFATTTVIKPPITTFIPGTKQKKSIPSKTLLKKAIAKLELGYIAEIKRQGKWIPISRKPLTRIGAIKIGERKVRETLAASFRVKPKGYIKTSKVEFGYTPSTDIFRTYKKRKGAIIPLKDEWIQKAGKRLSARSEVSEILKSKRSKSSRWL